MHVVNDPEADVILFQMNFYSALRSENSCDAIVRRTQLVSGP
jgi:hypothetical protein